MSTSPSPPAPARLDLTRWRKLPAVLVVAGALGALLGLALDPRQFGHSWLLAFMFYLSLCLGALFLVIVHHLFDASWSLPLRRFCEHLAALAFPWMALAFVPLAVLAPRIYPWMQSSPETDHALHAKWPLFTWPGFYLASALCLGLWGLFSHRLRAWSLRQDRTGAAECTFRMRRYAAGGIVVFALTLTLAAVFWMKALQHQWFSTMYGVYYFAGSVWLAVATSYFIAMILQRTGILGRCLHEQQFYFLGTLFLAFTVFYAYIHFSQYFIIWNANLPEETYWYVVREKGSWAAVGLVIIFGHFALPFLALLRIDLKLAFWWMTPLCAWAWAMHYVDLSFNVHPVLHPDGFPWRWLWLDLACLALLGGTLAAAFVRNFAAHPPYPLKDPRLAEALGVVHSPTSPISGGEPGQTDRDRNGGALERQPTA